MSVTLTTIVFKCFKCISIFGPLIISIIFSVNLMGYIFNYDHEMLTMPNHFMYVFHACPPPPPASFFNTGLGHSPSSPPIFTPQSCASAIVY